VRAPGAVDLIPVGSTTTLAFTVTNFDAPGTFSYIATDDKGFLVGNGSGSVSLNTSESKQILVSVAPPASTPGFTSFTVNLIASQTGVAEASNNADIELVTRPLNQPPICTAATPSTTTLRPPNHRFVDIGIQGVTDPDGDSLTIAVIGITQDEPVDGKSDGHTAPDGAGVGTPIASVRAERSGKGDGRVYAISFSADDGRGGTCQGVVTVNVPKKKGRAAIDSGQRFDSTIVPPDFQRDDDNDDGEGDDEKDD